MVINVQSVQYNLKRLAIKSDDFMLSYYVSKMLTEFKLSIKMVCIRHDLCCLQKSLFYFFNVQNKEKKKSFQMRISLRIFVFFSIFERTTPNFDIIPQLRRNLLMFL